MENELNPLEPQVPKTDSIPEAQPHVTDAEPTPQVPAEEATYAFRGEDLPVQDAPRYAPAPEEAPVKRPRKQKKQKKPIQWTTGKIIALALCCSLVGGVLGTAAALQLSKTDQPSVGEVSQILEGLRENTVLDVHQIDTSKLMTPAEVYATNVNSTVGITTSITTNYFGYQTTAAAAGSGFILSADGYILTNYHVIESSSAISVSMYNGDSYDATLIGYDASNDIAVLKINATDLTPVILGDSDNMNVGDSVVAIGNPLGELTFSLTSGTVSALSRSVTMSNGVTMELIQTDCAINSGNSGGALFNLYGEVVGITNAKYSTSSSSEASIDNIGFAIPVNDIRGIVESIITDGYIAKPYIGLSVTTVSQREINFGLPAGASIEALEKGAPAEQAGLQLSDIITAVNGTPITSSTDLVEYVKDCAVGDQLTLTVYRQNQTLTIELTVGEKIQSARQDLEESQQQQQPQQQYPSGGYGDWRDFWDFFGGW